MFLSGECNEKIAEAGEKFAENPAGALKTATSEVDFRSCERRELSFHVGIYKSRNEVNSLFAFVRFNDLFSS